ncbi:putative N-myristoyltransferase [Acanthamoeba polyphaga mimivirus]|uniref:glycylpeptide N-tetradecanoyltransferase n=1 Tax=Acanthamoeba polyphaga mimivirus TaxID=212035 RepID=A0A0G2Y145_MIMIV|nr:putative N-myristoyltransferase [Hirudovirus strain Sangsue]AKI79400.1 putative N-myristoyltransferase [Acanthamoeba polyphaga mimivirus]EJN41043.1 putative N-myristoyltransferase [Acanthamoeba polyphaga lentillevirus]UMZ07841.1 putative N-myristoyltransferase [Acanthamoeba polyphaga mimivirus]
MSNLNLFETNQNKSISIMTQDITKLLDPLTEKFDGFSIKTLNVKHVDEIHELLNKHYIEDNDHIIRIIYSRDFLYWYLKYVPNNFIIGLMYKNKLVGLITALFVDMIMYDNKIKIPYINFFCIQNKIRKFGLSNILIEELKSRLLKIGVAYSLFTRMNCQNSLDKYFTSTIDFAIPINYPKLKSVGFIPDDEKLMNWKIENNPLSLMVKTDILSVTSKLNIHLQHLSVRPYLTEDSVHHFILPKKNIVYTFVKRDSRGYVTDMVSVYKHYAYILETGKIISNAQLSFYYNETMDLTQLILLLLDKLINYGFDQLIFRNFYDNEKINITRFETNGELNYYAGNISMPITCPNNMFMIPI